MVNSASIMAAPGSFSEGLSTKVLPEATASGYSQSGTMAGKLNGQMPAQTCNQQQHCSLEQTYCSDELICQKGGYFLEQLEGSIINPVKFRLRKLNMGVNFFWRENEDRGHFAWRSPAKRSTNLPKHCTLLKRCIIF